MKNSMFRDVCINTFKINKTSNQIKHAKAETLQTSDWKWSHSEVCLWLQFEEVCCVFNASEEQHMLWHHITTFNNIQHIHMIVRNQNVQMTLNT